MKKYEIAGLAMAGMLCLLTMQAQAVSLPGLTVPAATGSETTLQEVLGDPVGSSAVVHASKTEEEYEKAYEKAKNANWGYTNLGIANVEDNLNVRAVAAEDGRLVGKLPKNAACEVVETEGEWAHIKSGPVEGYVKSDYP